MNKSFFYISIIFFLNLSCDNKYKSESVFLGGQIINPSSNYLILYKNNSTIDCLLLDANNSFSKNYEKLDSGIYKIEHIPEYQSIILEPGDSIWFRVNASDFNESLVYSGNGASKNNFLMDMKLKIENENIFLSSKYSLESESFSIIIDSLVNDKKNIWKEMDSINNLTEFSQKITMGSYVYPYAKIRERYALLRGTFWDSLKDSMYFGYRKFLNFNDSDLAYFDPYINYVLNYLNEISLDSSNFYFANKQLTNFNIKRLQILDKKIDRIQLKNNLARAIAYEEILNFTNHAKHESFLQYYFAVNTNTNFLAEVINLHNDIAKMGKGYFLPIIKLQNYSLETIESNLIFDGRPTVIYFWSQTQMNHYRETLRRLEMIKLEKPKYRYIGISIQPLNNLAIQVHEIMGNDPNNQFAIANFEVASKKWIITLLNKAIILNSNGKIVNGFGNLFDNNFIDQLN
tara:strand:+ start:7860 stop:9236 length:1377 start_codon:yes stop_codon:yes gene_type:complete